MKKQITRLLIIDQSKHSQNELYIRLKEMTDSKKLDSLEIIQTNCVWIVSQSNAWTAKQMRTLNQSNFRARKREICMTMQQIMRTMQREFKLIQILNAI